MDEILCASPQFFRDKPFCDNHFSLDLRQKSGWILVHLRREVVAFGLSQEQCFFCAGNRDIHKPSFLLFAILFPLSDSPEIRENAFAEACDENKRKL